MVAQYDLRLNDSLPAAHLGEVAFRFGSQAAAPTGYLVPRGIPLTKGLVDVGRVIGRTLCFGKQHRLDLRLRWGQRVTGPRGAGGHKAIVRSSNRDVALCH